MSSTCPTLSSIRSSFQIRQARRRWRRPSAGRSRRTRGRRSGSPCPRRTGAPRPPSRRRRDGAANTVCVVRSPRRLSASSITSSWNRAKACISSKAAPASTTIGSSGSPPQPTNAQWQNAGRSRLPPDSTSRWISAIGSARSGSNAAHRASSGVRNCSSRLDDASAIGRRLAGASTGTHGRGYGAIRCVASASASSSAITSSMRSRAVAIRSRHSAISSAAPGDPVGEPVDVDVGALELAQDGVELAQRLGVSGWVVRWSWFSTSGW